MRTYAMTKLAATILASAILWAGCWTSDASAGDADWQKFCASEQPDPGDWDNIPILTPELDLLQHCLELGQTARVTSSDFGDLSSNIPLDVASVSLVFADPNDSIDLSRFSKVAVSPIARDIYCARTLADWKSIKAKCPLYSIYAPPPVGLALAEMGWGPSIFLEQGLPYDLKLSGKIAHLRSSQERLFAKTIELDGITSPYVGLSGMIITGDLILSNDKIDMLDLGGAIVMGHLRITNTQAQIIAYSDDALRGSMIHGGVETDQSSAIQGDYCAPWSAGTVAGPVYIPKC
jgi:hypothetical protein